MDVKLLDKAWISFRLDIVDSFFIELETTNFMLKPTTHNFYNNPNEI